MIDPITTKAISSALLAPVIGAAIAGAKKMGVKGLQKWEQTKFHGKIQKKISSIETLKTFWSADKLVSLLDFYYPSKIIVDDKKKHCQTLSELPAGNLIIEGIVGQGKSIYLRHLATSEIRSNQTDNFPIFIEFRTLSEKLSLENSIKNFLDDVNIDGYDDATFEYVMSSGKFILLLDAFDEIDEDVTKETFQQIERYSDKYEKLKIIVTSRPSSEIQKSTKFKILRLAPLGESDYTPFLAKLGLDSVFIAELKTSIKNSPSKISELIKTPLMLTLVVLAYRSVKEIPENLPDFFEILFKCVFSGHDNAKPYIKRTLATDLSEKKLQELFEAFCFVCLKNKITRSLSTEQFDKIFDSSKTLLESHSCEAVDFRQDMNKVACLILPDGFDTWVFLHKSVMEYYAASFVKRSSESFAIRFYQYAISDPRQWMEVLTFLSYIDEYRFNKYYLTADLDAVLNEMAFIEECKDSKLILDYLDDIGLEFFITFQKSTEIEIVDVRFSSGKIRYSTRNIISAPQMNLLRSIIKNELKVINPELFNSIKIGASSDGPVTLNCRQILKVFDDSNFLVDFKQLFGHLQKKKNVALDNIRAQEARCAFLDM
jgi:hypothetical protein